MPDPQKVRKAALFSKYLMNVGDNRIEQCGCHVQIGKYGKRIVLTACELHKGLGRKFPFRTCFKCMVTFSTRKAYLAHREEKHSIG